MNVSHVIAAAQTFGVDFEISGGQLTLKRGKLLSPLLIEKIRENKPSVIEALVQDHQAREAGFLPLLPFEVYEKQLTPDAHVFIFRSAEGRWSAWRESFGQATNVTDDDGNMLKTMRKSISVKEIVTDAATFDYALFNAVSYINNFRKS